MDDYRWINDYMGKPYAQLAYGPDCFDCYGLVWHVCKTRGGMDLPKFHDIQYQAARIDAEIKGQAASKDWQQVQEAREFDVVVMQRAGEALHVGVWLAVDGGRVLHATRRGVYCNDLGGLHRQNYRQLKFYRHMKHETV